MKTIDIYVIDDSKFDLTLWIDSALTWGDVGITGVRDMIRKIIAMCSKGDKIGKLTIVGHGNEYGQWVGADWLCQEVIPAWRSELSKLTFYFGFHAQVIMGGCRQGRNGGFLLALSDIWNVPVVGYTALQRPLLPGYRGGETVCFITCTRTGRTAADSFDDIEIRVINYLRSLISSPVDIGRKEVLRASEMQIVGGFKITVIANNPHRSTLSGIAKAQYGDYNLWPLIYDLNKGKIGPNPNLLKPGTELLLLPIEVYTNIEIDDARKRAPSWREHPLPDAKNF